MRAIASLAVGEALIITAIRRPRPRDLARCKSAYYRLAAQTDSEFAARAGVDGHEQSRHRHRDRAARRLIRGERGAPSASQPGAYSPRAATRERTWQRISDAGARLRGRRP